MLPQVGALRERIDELSEDLELARAAAAAAAAAAAVTAAGTSAPGAAAAADGGGSNRSSAAGPAAVQVGDSDRQQREQEQEQEEELLRPASPGRELSERRVAPVRQVPLMAEDTPLEALHAQVRLNLNLNSDLKTCAPTSRCQSSIEGTSGGSRGRKI